MSHALRYAILGFVGTWAVASVDAAAQSATGSFRRTLAVETPLDLEVRTGSGSIVIRQGAGTEAEVVGDISVYQGFLFWRRNTQEAEETVRALEADPPIELAGNRLRVGDIEDPAHRRSVSISYEIVVPAETAVRSHTGSGSQTLSGLAGSVIAGAGSGQIELAEIRGAVRASTGSGSIRADGIAGAFNGSTGSGSVTLEQTASGAIDISTGSGSVRVRLPPGAAFELDARTGSGAISTDHPLTVEGEVERNALRGSSGSGGPPIRIRTGSGSIRIE